MVLPLTRHRPNVPISLESIREKQQERLNNKHHSRQADDTNAITSSAAIARKPPPLITVASSRQQAIAEPVSALHLLQRNRQDAPSRLSLLLPPPNSTSTFPIFPLSLGITELYGSAGSGKTQIGLSTCVSCVASSSTNNKMALYVSLGEGSSRARLAQRLHQMASSRTTTTTSTTIDGMLQRILTRFLRNQDECMAFVMEELPTMLQQQQHCKIGVVVLDSIAGMFRIDNGSYKQRSQLLFQIATQLKRLSDFYRVSFLIMNQVSCSLSTNSTVPALGLSWASCVNESYQVERNQVNNSGSGEDGSSTTNQQQQQQQQAVFARSITCMRSSSRARVSCCFTIQASGVVGKIS